MKVLTFCMILLIIFTTIQWVGSQWCTKELYAIKTKLQWNTGQRQVSYRNMFGKVKHKYEPYTFSTIQYYNDWEIVRDCCRGYQKINSTYCKPICIFTCPQTAYCHSPNVCRCNEGYTNTAIYGIQCRPICTPECPANSNCTAPNTCSCSEGYTKNSLDQCEPVCSNKCSQNATCIAPNQCRCNEGYKLSLDNTACEPVCSIACPIDAMCTESDICLCNEGYELGKTEDNSLVCVPKCEEDCPDNSFCSIPNFCECESDYKKSFYGECQPICEPTCPDHATCIAPNNCTCMMGYESTAYNQCQPICNTTCPEYGQCIAPNKCGCSAGYMLKLTSTYNLYCEPQCQQNCSTFAKCTEPNKCECLEGYEMDDMDICKPICSKGCSNGLCIRPDVCICFAGFLMGPNDQCEPVCSVPCQNATCVEPEICQCSPGYTMKNGSISICEPQCQPACINGICIDANVCICLENFEPKAMPDGSHNHSNCQGIDTTRVTTYQYSLPTSSYHDINFSSTTPTYVSSDICIERCQCWEEYDELGSLNIKPQCVHVCLDAFDRPCLNVSSCQCNSSDNILHCRQEDEDKDSSEEDEIFLYICRVPKQKEFIKDMPNSKTIDISKSRNENKNTGVENNLWIVLGAIIGAGYIGTMAAMLYTRCKRREVAVMEYEM